MRPRAGDIWTIPAGVRAVLCTRANGKFCAIALPNGMLGHRELASRIQSRDPFLSQVTEQIAQIVDRDDPATHPLRESLIETVGLHLKDQYCDGLPAPGHARLDPVTQAAIRELLEDGFDSEITLSALADLAGLPVRSFRAAFGATFGTSPHQYILDGRIARAQTLLATTDHHDVLGVIEPPARRRFEGLGYEGELHARGGYAFCWRVCGSSGYRNHGRRRAAVGSCGGRGSHPRVRSPGRSQLRRRRRSAARSRIPRLLGRGVGVPGTGGAWSAVVDAMADGALALHGCRAENSPSQHVQRACGGRPGCRRGWTWG